MNYDRSNLLGLALGFLLGAGFCLLYSYRTQVFMNIPDPSLEGSDFREAALFGVIGLVLLGFPLGWMFRRIQRLFASGGAGSERS